VKVAARICAACLIALGAVGATASPAAAEFGPIRLASKSAVQQAGEAVAPSISADGRYLAFQGTIGGLKGVFRKDLQSGAVVPVCVGSAYESGAPCADAAAPSISADGRYVAFTTAAPLDPLDDEQASSKDVYVADMAAEPPTYALASALDGGAAGLTYGGAGGSEASGRVALSADGREVVFVTTASSNLTGDPAKTETPAGQVVLRDLDTQRTTLVSVERDPETEAMTGRPVAGGGVVAKPEASRGATLSADGTTVAWLGAHLPAQVPLAPAEAETIAELDATGGFPYDEPLWRRVGDGATAPTRRIVAGDGPADPFPFPDLTNKSTGTLNKAEGWLGVEGVDAVPRLSADGRTVALIGNPTEATNVFLVDMRDGLSRAQAVRQLTREVPISAFEGPEGINSEKNIPLDGHVFDLAISADGRRIAFATARQRFPLAPPNLISSPPSTVGAVELYRVDLEGETLERVTHGDGGTGEPSLPALVGGIGAGGGFGASAPSFGGELIAFASTASNLVPGDGNEASDAFTVEDDEAPRLAGSASISPPPGQRRRRPRWQLKLSAFSLPDGSVRLVALVPAQGTLHAGIAAEQGGGPNARRLAAARARARGDGPVALRIELPRRYRRSVDSEEGVYAMARVSFHRHGRRTLHGSLQVRFHAHRSKRRGRGG
jgi:Tol biopolymer transport system component